MPIDSGNLALKGLDDLFSTEENRQEEQREQVQQIPIDELHPFTNHPFKVLDDEAMTRTVESIAQYGVLAPLIARPRPEGGYEIISGHRRKHAAELAHLDTVPVIVRNMEDDAATILMVDSNLQREHILPSERAFAYKMKLDAIKNQGARSDLTSRQVVGKLEAADEVGKATDESGRQVQRFIRLTNLVPELLDMVDEKKISFNPAVELSYLDALKVDPEFQGKIPPLTFEELNQLEANILRDGRIINPIIVWEGLIVDGHNRFIIAKKHPEIPFTVHETEFANRYEAIIWICKNQLGRRNLTPEQKKYLIGKQYEAEKLNHGGDQKSNLKKSTGQNGQSIDKRWTRRRIADENGVNDSFVKRAEQFSKGVDAAEKAVPGTRQKVLTGEVKPTAAEIASVARAPPEERPALVAEICKPKDQKKAAMTRTTPPPAAKPLSDSSTSEEESTDEELVHTPAPQEQTFPQRVNEPLKIDRQQILEIANSRYVPKRLADGTAMLCEVSGAANSMMRRWESVFREYPDILSDAENRASVERTIQKLRDYLKNLEDKMEELL